MAGVGINTAKQLMDHYDSTSEFECILEDARMQAQNDKEEEFVEQTSKKYKEWGGRMFWSDKQDAWLRNIAGADDE